MSPSTLALALALALALGAVALSGAGGARGGSKTSPSVFRALVKAADKGDGVIRLTRSQYDRWLDTGPRNYTVVLALTTLDARQFGACAACVALHNDMLLLADALLRQHSYDMTARSFTRKPVFFAELDYSTDTAELFQKYYLRGVPHVAILKASHDAVLRLPAMNEQSSTAHSAEEVSRLLQAVAGVRVRVQRPVWPQLLAGVAMLAAAYVLVAKLLPWLYYNARSPLIPFALTLVVFFFVMAGTVFNLIRSPPPYDLNPYTGKMMLFSPGGRSQFVAEGAVAAGLMTVAGLCHVALNTIASNARLGELRVRIAFYVTMAAYVAVLGMLMHVFQFKFGFYPFKAPRWLSFLDIVGAPVRH